MTKTAEVIDGTAPDTFDPVVAIGAGEKHAGQVGGTTPRVTQTFTRLDEATSGAYAIGDLIANSTTAASVVPITFSVGRAGATIVSGRISGCRGVVAPASGNLVTAALDFDLLLFRPNTSIPFAAGLYPADNAALAVSAAAMRDLVAIFSFVNSGWRSPAGSTSVAGVSGYQSVLIASGRNYAPFNLADLTGATTLLGLVQAQGLWTPGHINQQFDFALDVDVD